LLADAQDLAIIGGVIGVQHTVNVIDPVPVQHGVVETLGIEQVEIELDGWLSPPEAQGIDIVCAESGDRHVVGDRKHIHVIVMDQDLLIVPAHHKGIASFHPDIRILLLEPVLDRLAEQAVAVEDAIAGHGQILGGAGIQKAGGQAAQATIAEGCVIFLFFELGQIIAQTGDGLPDGLIQAEIDQIIDQ